MHLLHEDEQDFQSPDIASRIESDTRSGEASCSWSDDVSDAGSESDTHLYVKRNKGRRDLSCSCIRRYEKIKLKLALTFEITSLSQ